MAVTAKPFGTPNTSATVLKPGEVPPFPVASDLPASDKTAIAAEAWARAKGSIKAFGLLVQEHMRGAIDLLEKKPPAAVAPAPGPAAAAPVVSPAKTA